MLAKGGQLLASQRRGLPVAAYPVPGPLDILGPHGRGIHGGKWPIGALDEDLAIAVERALRADRSAAIREAQHYSWEACTRSFLDGLAVDRVSEVSSRAA